MLREDFDPSEPSEEVALPELENDQCLWKVRSLRHRIRWASDKLHELEEFKEHLLETLTGGQPELIEECDVTLQEFMDSVENWREQKSEARSETRRLLRELCPTRSERYSCKQETREAYDLAVENGEAP